MGEVARDVDSVRAGHAILATRAGHKGKLHIAVGYRTQQRHLLVVQRLKGCQRTQIVLQMFHIGHTAEHRQYSRHRTRKTESPRGQALLGSAALQLVDGKLRQVSQLSTQQRLHHKHRYVAFGQLAVEVLRIGIPSPVGRQRVGMLPVDVIVLDEHMVPMHLLVHGQCFVKHLHIAVIGEPQVADTPFGALLHQPLQHSVVDKAAHEHIVRGDGVSVQIASRKTHTMEHVKIDIIHLQPFQRLLEHLDAPLAAPQGGILVGELGTHQILVAAVAAEGFAHRYLRTRLAITRSCVEEIDTVRYGVVGQLVDAVLIQVALGLVAVLAVFCRRQAHTAIPQQRHLFAVCARAVRHLVGRHLARGESFGTRFVWRVATCGHRCRDQGTSAHAF